MSVVQEAASITSFSCPTAAAKPANTASGSDGFREGRQQGGREKAGEKKNKGERWEEREEENRAKRSKRGGH